MKVAAITRWTGTLADGCGASVSAGSEPCSDRRGGSIATFVPFAPSAGASGQALKLTNGLMTATSRTGMTTTHPITFSAE